MDILHLVDRLEELFNESRPIWFTHNVIMDEDRLLDIIDQMRVSIPEEIKKSQQLIIQKDRMLAQTQEEANRTLSLAREKADQVVEKDQIVVSAQARAEQILAQTRQECDQIKREADDYVMQTLQALKVEMEKSLNQINNGIAAIEGTRKPSESIE
jgi:cell division septum initiation protein DivIVA